MKQIKTSFIPLTMLAAATLLGACSSAPDYVACPQLTSPIEGTRVYLKTDTQMREVDVRFNGVNALCTKLPNGDTRMDVAVGLKMKRDAEDGLDDILSLPVLAAFVDDDDSVTYSETQLYKAGYRKGEVLKYPIMELQFDVPPGNRLVLSLATKP